MTDQTAPAAAEQAPARKDRKFETITLDTPIERGEQTIKSVQVRKPKGGELRGCDLQSLLQGDVNMLLTVIPRITVPPLLPHEAEELESEDLAQFAGAIRGFFMSRSEQEALQKVLGIYDRENSTT